MDSFFPVLNEIEKEVTAIDHMVYDSLEPEAVSLPTPSLKRYDTPKTSQTLVERVTSVEKDGDAYYTPAEKLREAYRPRFVSPRLSARLLVRRLRRQIGMTWDSFWAKPPAPPNERHEALRRMARTRKQVTVLGRLLATKADVVSQIRKRLGKAGQSSTSDEQEVAIYMGDVEGAHLLLEYVIERPLMYSTSRATCRPYLDLTDGARTLRAFIEPVASTIFG